jgi:hypothetical protein
MITEKLTLLGARLIGEKAVDLDSGIQSLESLLPLNAIHRSRIISRLLTIPRFLALILQGLS